jgi:hypothetical protein
MHKLIIRGTGQLNGPVSIHKEIEVEDSIAKKIAGRTRNEVLIGLLAVHYPGVAIDPSRISYNLTPISKPKVVKPIEEKSLKNTSSSKNKNKPQKNVTGSIFGALSNGLSNVVNSTKNTDDLMLEKKISDAERFALLKNGKSTNFSINREAGEIFSTEKFIKITISKIKWLGGKEYMDIEIPFTKIKEIKYKRILFGMNKQIVIKCFDRSIIKKITEKDDIELEVKNEKEAIELVEYAKQFLK